MQRPFIYPVTVHELMLFVTLGLTGMMGGQLAYILGTRLPMLSLLLLIAVVVVVVVVVILLQGAFHDISFLVMLTFFLLLTDGVLDLERHLFCQS